MAGKCNFQEVKFIPKLAINTSTNIYLYSIKQRVFFSYFSDKSRKQSRSELHLLCGTPNSKAPKWKQQQRLWHSKRSSLFQDKQIKQFQFDQRISQQQPCWKCRCRVGQFNLASKTAEKTRRAKSQTTAKRRSPFCKFQSW